jgi:hypothetical protein
MPKSDKLMAEAVARQIDDNLQRIYAVQLEDQIPDRFQQLLQQLRDKEKPQ